MEGYRKVSIQEKHGRGESQAIQLEKKGAGALDQSRDPVQEDPEQPVQDCSITLWLSGMS